MIRTTLFAALLVALCGCSGSPEPAEATVDAATDDTTAISIAPVRSLSGTMLLPPEALPDKAKLEADLTQARAALDANPDDVEALIWVGRRLGYLWRYHEAIELFSEGIERWPDNAKLYRHRGHRYITVRDFPHALADFQKAAALIEGKPDEVEPDGQPNKAGIPRTTLAYNIWYHLGLTHYLQGNFSQAMDAYAEILKISDNDDSVVAVTDWMWMSLMRQGRKNEAMALLDKITPKMDVLENDSYHRRLLMYKGDIKPDALLDINSTDHRAIATEGYGLGNYYLVTGETQKAKDVFEKVISGVHWNAFGYIAAEADLKRLK